MSRISAKPFTTTLNSGSTPDTKAMEAIVFKLLKGEALNPAEKNLLKNNNKDITDDHINKLIDYLTIQGNAAENITDTYQLPFAENPFMFAAERTIGHKRANFHDELTKFNERMKDIFGADYPGQDQITKLIELAETAKSATDDTFEKAVRAELRDKNTSSEGFQELDALDDNALNILALGTLGKVSLSEIGSGPTGTSIKPTPQLFDEDIQLGFTHRDWLQNLDSVLALVTSADAIGIAPLKNKLLNLEELQEGDKEALKYFLSLKNMPVNDTLVDQAFKQFNGMINSTRAMSPTSIENPEIKAALIAQQAKLPKFNNQDTNLLMEAVRLLNQNPPQYNQQNEGIKAAEKLFKTILDANQELSQKEEALVLRNLLNRLLKEKQAQNAENYEKHYSKLDQGRLYRDFKDQIFTLETFLNDESLEESHRRALIADMTRFIRGEEPSKELEAAFKGSPQKDLRQALDYFKDSYGDPNANCGILELIADNSESAIDFNALVQGSQSFDELASNLNNAIIGSQLEGRTSSIPKSLLAESEYKTADYLSDLANLKQKTTTDEKGNKSPVDDFTIFNQLKFDLKTTFTKPKNNNNDEYQTIATDLKKASESLYQLLQILCTDDNEIGKLIASCLEADETEGKSGIPNNGRKLAELIETNITKLEHNIQDYKQSDSSNFPYSTMMETRQKLVEFSRKNDLGFFTQEKLPAALSQDQYKDILLNFSMAATRLDSLVKCDHSIYQTPSSLKVDYNHKSEQRQLNHTSVSTSSAGIISYEQSNQIASTGMDFDSWLDRLFKSSYSAVDGYFEEEEEDTFKKIMGVNNVASTKGYFDPFGDSGLKQNFDFFA